MAAISRRDKTPYNEMYERPVEEGGRIRLPAAVVRQQQGRGVTRVWVGKIPGKRALILCPEGAWSGWIDSMKRLLPVLRTPDGVRTFLAASTRRAWDRKNRISIPSRLLRYARIEERESVVVLGMGDYFEIWAQSEYEEVTERCMEEVNQSLQEVIATRKASNVVSDGSS